jgi:prevent-host-death family protein
MKKTGITETKNNLSALIDGLRGGSPALIVDRGRPVARLEPVAGREEGEQEGRLVRLRRRGPMRPPSNRSSTSAGKGGEIWDASAIAPLLVRSVLPTTPSS